MADDKRRSPPTHITPWSYQDWRTSRIRMRSVTTNDPYLRLVYLEALSALPEHGGSLPSDPAVLADILLVPEKEIRRCLPLLDDFARQGDSRGGLLLDKRAKTVTNRRVTEDLEARRVFVAKKAVAGKLGGEAKAAAAALAESKQKGGKKLAPASKRLAKSSLLSLPILSVPLPSQVTQQANTIPQAKKSRLQRAVALRCAQIAAKIEDSTALAVLKSVSVTADGNAYLTDLRNASESWLIATLEACDRFEDDHA